jgi:hypothetical protein
LGLNLPAIYYFIIYFSIFSNLLPLVFFLLNKIHSKEKSLKVILCYILYCIINDAIGYYLQQDSSILVAVFNVVEFSSFCLFYYFALPPGAMKKAIFPIMGLFLAFACIDFFFINRMSSFDSILTGVESILIILMCIYYLIVQIKGSNNLFVYSTSNFWIIITFLIYLSGSFFLYIMAETMYHNRAFQIQYTIINSVFYILKNILLSIAMLMKATPVKNQTRKNDDWGNDVLSYKLKN